MVAKDKYIQRLKELHLKKKGVALSPQEAERIFSTLIVLTKAIYKPIIIENIKNE